MWANIAFAAMASAHWPVFGPKTDSYVTTETAPVTLIDPDTQDRGRDSHRSAGEPMLALSRTTGCVATPPVGPGTVSVLDVKARKTLSDLRLGQRCNALPI